MTESEVSRQPKTLPIDSDRSSKAGSGQHRRNRRSLPECEASAPRIPGSKHKRHVSNDELNNSYWNVSTPSSTSLSKGAHPPSSLPTPNPLDAPLSPAPIRDGELPASRAPTKHKVSEAGPASPNRRKNKVPASPAPAVDKFSVNPTRRKQKTPASPAPAIDKPPAGSTRIKDKYPASPAPVPVRSTRRKDKVPESPAPRDKLSASSTRIKDKVPASPAPTRDEVPASSTRRRDENPVSPVPKRDEGPASQTRRKEKVPASPAPRRDEAPASPTHKKGKISTSRAPKRSASTGNRRDSAPAKDEDPASPTRRAPKRAASTGTKRDSAPVRDQDPASPAPRGDSVPASPALKRDKVPASRSQARDEVTASPSPRRGSAPASSDPRKDRVPAGSAPKRASRRDRVPASPAQTRDEVTARLAPRRNAVPASPASPASIRDKGLASRSPRKDEVAASPGTRRSIAPSSSARRDTDPASPALRRDNVPTSPAPRKEQLLASRAPARDEVPASPGPRSDSAPASSDPRKDRVPAGSAPARDKVPFNSAPGKDSAPASLSPENMPVSPPSRRMRSFEIGENSFDVDAPHDSFRQRPDCASLAESTLIDSLTGEERAWAGIEAVLDDIESVATHDILPEAIIRSRSSSSSSKPATSFLRKGRPEDDDDDSDIDSHDAFMEGLNAEQSSDGDDMPPLASYSSLMSTVSAAQDLVENPMKEFMGSMTDTMERKQQAGPEPSSPDGGNAIYNMFSWSSKKNVDEIEGETQGNKESFIERHPGHGILTSTQKRKNVLASPLGFVDEDVCNKSMPSLSDYSMPSRSEDSMPSLSEYSTPSLSEYSMPSLSSVRESEAGSTNVRGKSASFADLKFDYCLLSSPSEVMDPSSADMSEKWASFGDLDVDYGRVAPTDQKVPFGDMPKTAERRSTKTKTKKAPKPALKKKKLKRKIRLVEVIKEINAPEALLDYYKAPDLAVPENPAIVSKKDKYGVTTMRNFKSPVASLRNRLPKLGLFGKGRRNSPTSITDGCQESQFYPEMDDGGGEEEEFGGLLYS